MCVSGWVGASYGLPCVVGVASVDGVGLSRVWGDVCSVLRLGMVTHCRACGCVWGVGVFPNSFLHKHTNGIGMLVYCF